MNQPIIQTDVGAAAVGRAVNQQKDLGAEAAADIIRNPVVEDALEDNKKAGGSLWKQYSDMCCGFGGYEPGKGMTPRIPASYGPDDAVYTTCSFVYGFACMVQHRCRSVTLAS